jgi:hypothetical protein
MDTWAAIATRSPDDMPPEYSPASRSRMPKCPPSVLLAVSIGGVGAGHPTHLQPQRQHLRAEALNVPALLDAPLGACPALAGTSHLGPRQRVLTGCGRTQQTCTHAEIMSQLSRSFSGTRYRATDVKPGERDGLSRTPTRTPHMAEEVVWCGCRTRDAESLRSVGARCGRFMPAGHLCE